MAGGKGKIKGPAKLNPFDVRFVKDKQAVIGKKKKAEVDAKKQKKEADAAEKPKPTQKPLSKLDRIVQRENAQKEAKKVQGHDHAARTAPPRTHVPCAEGG